MRNTKPPAIVCNYILYTQHYNTSPRILLIFCYRFPVDQDAIEIQDIFLGSVSPALKNTKVFQLPDDFVRTLYQHYCPFIIHMIYIYPIFQPNRYLQLLVLSIPYMKQWEFDLDYPSEFRIVVVIKFKLGMTVPIAVEKVRVHGRVNILHVFSI